jgi:hypothetical protein
MERVEGVEGWNDGRLDPASLGLIGAGSAIETSIFHTGILRFSGEAINEITGAEIWMDDVTGDGLGDVIIGRQNYTPAVGPTARQLRP